MAYTRKTTDEYTIQGDYGYGWEDLTASDSRKLARDDLKAYRANEPGNAFRMVTRRIPKKYPIPNTAKDWS